ncbi:MAG: tetratricopeptide repeat protein [Deltaproteobacteria bacterium]|nr:tetratricopeptide repeat protein [Deltaproteobacteria bacterium]MDQ3301002.1 tetratricopeptide repeat protein [Myxococcota bacterium]
MRRELVIVVMTALVAANPAWAQSKKYPPVPVDKDEEAAQRSELWDQATDPHKLPYAELVKEAQKLLGDRTADSALVAVKKLDQAIALVPGEAEAYRVRGDAHLQLLDWGKCAGDFQAAWTQLRLDPDSKGTPSPTMELRRKLGLCQARNGKLADAEQTFAEAAATGVNSVEIWMRLGEVRIAMGRLEEAITALKSAIEQTDITAQALARWLLAAAYDRARRPSDAKTTAGEALTADRNLATLKNPTLPLLGVGESDYLLGLAYESFPAETPRPEHALIYFRRFLKVAADSPWRRRAEDHVRELRTAQLPDTVDRTSGNAPLDEKDARPAVRKAMPAMRACLAKHPYIVMRVLVTRVGPRTRETARDRPRYQAPPEGVTIEQDESLEPMTRAEIDSAIRCIEPIAAKIPLPPIKEKDTYYKLQFRVVGP